MQYTVQSKDHLDNVKTLASFHDINAARAFLAQCNDTKGRRSLTMYYLTYDTSAIERDTIQASGRVVGVSLARVLASYWFEMRRALAQINAPRPWSVFDAKRYAFLMTRGE